MNTNLTKSFSPEDRDQVRQLALDASEPITLFWPMRSMIAQNPRHDCNIMSGILGWILIQIEI